MENTNPQGSENLNVNQAASAFESLMGDSEEAEQGQTEEQTEELEASDEVERVYYTSVQKVSGDYWDDKWKTPTHKGVKA